MKLRIIIGVIFIISFIQIGMAQPKVRIKRASGDVKIRRGVEETWHIASAGTWLEEIDSILTGEGSVAILELLDGTTFRLGGNAMLDIADLRKITEQELFLMLMSKKIRQIGPREEKTKLRIGYVNVVHGELKRDTLTSTENNGGYKVWELEKNGALALYSQNFTTNSILKMNNILIKYPNVNDCGELHFYLGKAFETLNKPGQALDFYKIVLKKRLEASCQDFTAPWFD
ncbi:MAG: hypothetical protein ACE5JB_14140, partial [bacterium]